MNTHQRGRMGEASALAHLVAQGCAPVAQNVRNACGELDLIVRDGDALVFVEVKLRTTARYGSGREAVDARKRGRILRAAALYLQAEGWQGRVRFDVIEVDGDGGCRQFPGAFWA